VYVPAKDMAAVLKAKTIYSEAAGEFRYSLGLWGPDGVAEGRINEWAFNGRTRLMVKSVDYDRQHPQHPDKTAATATVQIRNATNRPVNYACGITGGPRTYYLYLDGADNTYEYSGEVSGFPGGDGILLLPGAAITFKVPAVIPNGVKVNRFVTQFLGDGRLERPFKIFLDH
ncbi:MAG: hypothetical protein ACREIS_14830, partial [Nitrospiraceae bacterium]